MSTDGSRCTNARNTGPRKFSSVSRETIGFVLLFAFEKFLCIRGNARPIQFFSNAVCFVVSLSEILLYLTAMLVKIGNGSVDITQRERCVLPNNLFRGMSLEITPNNKIKQHVCLPNPNDSLIIDVKGSIKLSNIHIFGSIV